MITITEIIDKLKDGTLLENEHIEFKQALTKTNVNDVAKVIVAMSNNGGGYLIVGVEEKPKGLNVVGTDPNLIRRFCNLMSQKLTTGFVYNLHELKINDKSICIVEFAGMRETTFFSRRDTTPERLTTYVINKVDGKRKFVSSDKQYYKNIYKYMTLESIIMSLYNRTWHFVEPNKWNDKYERRFYCAEYKIPHKADDVPQLFATCVTREPYSEAAWKVYASGQGLGSHCVQLEMDIVEVRNQLWATPYITKDKEVDYRSESFIFNLHKQKTSADYAKYFNNFTRDKFLDLLLLKRDAYRYEHEVRIFAIPKGAPKARNHGKKSDSKDLKVDWKAMIKSIKIDKNCSNGELLSFQQACYSAGIKPVFHNTTFTGIAPDPNLTLKDIDVYSYDIDEMPGSQRIIIK